MMLDTGLHHTSVTRSGNLTPNLRNIDEPRLNSYHTYIYVCIVFIDWKLGTWNLE